MSVTPRPLLQFRGGAPGFNPSHPAAKNNWFSYVAGPSGVPIMVNAGSTSGKPTVTTPVSATIDPYIGRMNSAGTTGLVTFGGFSTAAFTTVTVAIIGRLDDNTSNTNYFAFSDDPGGNLGCGLNVYNATATLPQVRIGSTSVNVGVAPTLKVPFFLAVSMVAGTAGSWVMRNLPHGSTVSGTIGAVPGTFSGGSGTLSVLGLGTFNELIGGQAATMRSNVFLTLDQLLTWANDPWAFWYPESAALKFSLRGPTTVGISGMSWFTPLDKQPVPQQSISVPSSAITLPPVSQPWAAVFDDTLVLRDSPVNDGISSTFSAGQIPVNWTMQWEDAVVLPDPPPTAPASSVILPPVPLQWAAVFDDTLILRDPPVEQLVSVALTPATLPVKISGMSWFAPPDRDRPATKVSIESLAALALTPATLPAQIKGVAWFAPQDRDRPATRISVESIAALALTPATLPPVIAGIPWFELLDRDYPSVKSFDAPPAFKQPIVQIPISGMAWYEPPPDPWKIIRQIPVEPPPFGTVPFVAPSLFWTNADDKPVRRVLFDGPAPAPTASALTFVSGMSWFTPAEQRQIARQIGLDLPSGAIAATAASQQLSFGWDDGGDDRLIPRRPILETQSSLIPTAGLLVPKWGWSSVSDDRIVRKVLAETSPAYASALLQALSSGWMTLVADGVVPAAYRELSREAVVLTQLQLPPPFGVQWAVPIDVWPALARRFDAQGTFIKPPPPVGISGIAWLAPQDQRLRSSWVFEGGAVPAFFGRKLIAFVPSPRRATSPVNNRGAVSTPP